MTKLQPGFSQHVTEDNKKLFEVRQKRIKQYIERDLSKGKKINRIPWKWLFPVESEFTALFFEIYMYEVWCLSKRVMVLGGDLLSALSDSASPGMLPDNIPTFPLYIAAYNEDERVTKLEEYKELSEPEDDMYEYAFKGLTFGRVTFEGEEYIGIILDVARVETGKEFSLIHVTRVSDISAENPMGINTVNYVGEADMIYHQYNEKAIKLRQEIEAAADLFKDYQDILLNIIMYACTYYKPTEHYTTKKLGHPRKPRYELNIPREARIINISRAYEVDGNKMEDGYCHSRKAHFRIGHWRAVAYGVGRQYRRQQWFPPTWVRGVE